MSMGNFDSFEPEPKAKLGKLAQSARKNHLKSARTALFIVGGLSIAANGYFYATAESKIKDSPEAQQLIRQAGAEGRKIVEQAVQTTQLMAISGCALGVMFVVFGLFIYKYPVPITILALVIYVGSFPIYAIWAQDASVIFRGFIVKAIIIGCLVKGIQAALAYEKERDQ